VLRDEVIPDDETVTARDKAPVKPFRLVRVSVTDPDEPEGILIEDGLALMPKSGGSVTVTEIVTEWERVPEFAVTCTEYDPAAIDWLVETVNVLVPVPPELRETMFGDVDAVAAEVDTDTAKLREPAKAPKLDNVRVVDPEEP
jgi:hypothetical protein